MGMIIIIPIIRCHISIAPQWEGSFSSLINGNDITIVCCNSFPYGYQDVRGVLYQCAACLYRGENTRNLEHSRWQQHQSAKTTTAVTAVLEGPLLEQEEQAHA